MKICPRFTVRRGASPRAREQKGSGTRFLRLHLCGEGQDGYLLMEALVYIGLVMVLLGVGYAAMYRCIDNSVMLRRNADDITGALNAGERWRADVRVARGQIRLENTDLEPTLYLPGVGAEVAYRLATPHLLRRVGNGPWVRVLANVKASTMAPDRRKEVTAWSWELELQPRGKGAVKPSRIRPLFTFLAVPESPKQP